MTMEKYPEESKTTDLNVADPFSTDEDVKRQPLGGMPGDCTPPQGPGDRGDSDITTAEGSQIHCSHPVENVTFTNTTPVNDDRRIMFSISSAETNGEKVYDDKGHSSKANDVPSATPVKPSDISFSELRHRHNKSNKLPSEVKDHRQTEKESSPTPLKNVSLSGYLYSELTRGYWMEHDEAKFTEKRQRVYTFMKIPRELEKFMIYGFFQCLDAFLYIFTFLPLRFIMALIKLCIRICLMPCWTSRGRLLEPAQICDLLKGLILIVCCVLMHYVDFSMMYHVIRGQEIIKLYIFFNMLEVADRLFSSFGQDILDSLFWTATESRNHKREHIGVIPHLFLAIVYVFLHAILVLLQATALNVAFNSHSKALLTIMMSNNFVELKGSVFKKFEKNNLFQMSCSDVRERFHLIILLGIVGIRNLTEFSWNIDHLWVLVGNMIPVIVAEVLVDWVKHAFITKFNEIPAEVYNEYTVSIAYDLASSRQKNAFSDLLDVVSRRMGFIPLPLAVLLVRVVVQSLRLEGAKAYIIILIFFLGLVTLKVLNSIVLLGISVNYIEQNKKEKPQSQPDSSPKAKEMTRSRSYEEINMASKTSSPMAGSPSDIPVRMTRSQSLSESLSETMVDTKEDATPPPREHSMTPKVLLSNSTVSLQSVGLNEEYMADVSQKTELTDKTPSSPKVGSPEKSKKDGSKKAPAKPLSEVDRYTMCSNRII